MLIIIPLYVIVYVLYNKAIEMASTMSQKGFFSARGFTRILRVARTIADLKENRDVSVEDVSEAAQFRMRGLA